MLEYKKTGFNGAGFEQNMEQIIVLPLANL